MDKKEYQEKLDEISALAASENYAEAAKTADSIDWKRVRNVQTLVMVSEIYEAVGRYEDSKVLLLRAYRRSPLGRTVLYRLVECTIHLGQFDEAIEYYSEYVQAAPHDNNRYILKYKIYRARGSSVEEQIDILREYLQEEYNEKWAYELARLQVQADRVQDAISTCDDLVLWFHSGKYVIKALELKKKYAPLTPKQQEIYDNRFNEEEISDEDDEEAAGSYLKMARERALAQRADAQQEEIKNELAADVTHAAKLETAKEEISQKARAASESVMHTAELSAKALARKAEEITGTEEQDISADDSQAAGGQEPAGTDEEAGGSDGAVYAVQPETEEVEDTAENGPENEEPEVTSGTDGGETSGDTPDEEISEEQLQEDMVRSMREIVAGVGPRSEFDEDDASDRLIEQSKEDQEKAVAARGTQMTYDSYASAGPEKTSAGKMNIDDVLLSMGDQGGYAAEGDGGSASVSKEETVDDTAPEAAADGYQEAADVDSVRKQADADIGDEAGREQPEPERDERAPGEDGKPESGTEETAGGEYEQREPEIAAADAGAAGADAEPGEAERKGNYTESLRAILGETRKEYTKEIAEARTKRLPVEEIRRIHEALLSEKSTGSSDEAAFTAASMAAQAAEKAAQMAEAEVKAAEETDADQAAAGTEGEGRQSSDIQTDIRGKKETPEDAAEAVQNQSSAEADSGDTAEIQQAERHPDDDTGRPRLKDSQRELFRGFTEIGTLEEQIAEAITQAESKNGDRTSKSGNILILGAHGSGKTTIATAIARAIAEDTGTHSIKLARIYAADLNRKDIAATIAKIAGGILIVEEAGDLDDAVVDQLTTAMEFRTDSMIMILEDEQRYIHDLLMRHPRFTMKFTAQIYIPAYTTDELVNFGRIYAESKDYALSDEAVTALRDRVNAVRDNGDEVSVTNVTELVDRAIHGANKFFRRIGPAKKRYDEMNRVILREKDFR